MELLRCYSVSYMLAYISGPPTFQPFDPVHYVIVGHSFVLNCTATNDPQSPNDLTFRWYKDRKRIGYKNLWNITEHIINYITITSQLVISDLQMIEHNGTYICEVNNYFRKSSVRQSTIIIVEGKFVSIRYTFIVFSIIALC